MSLVKIYSQNNEGEGITKVDNITTFIPYTLNGDVVNVNIVNKYKNYCVGSLENIVSDSTERQKPMCPYYYKCGGCDLMHQKYIYELDFKKNKVINNLSHIANVKIDNIEIISDNDLYYRNHIVLNVLNNKIGFYKYHTNEIIDIEECIISNKNINTVIKQLRIFIDKHKDHNIKRISIKSYKETLINIESLNFNYIDEFKSIVKSDSLFINDIFVSGKKDVTEVLNDKTYKITNASFFQKNTLMTIKLYDYIKNLVDEKENILDLYCGTGSIGIYIADKVKSVLGIEVIKDAIKNAKANALLNNIDNIFFKVGKVENSIIDIKEIDTVIVDPPRVGLNKKVIRDIISINAKKIIYVSCNSTTLSRDINLLKEIYDIKSIKLFDLFPNTHHIESVCELVLK